MILEFSLNDNQVSRLLSTLGGSQSRVCIASVWG